MPMLLPLLLAAAAPQPVTCQFGEAAPVPCTMRDEVLPDGRHRMVFAGGGRRILFVGRGQSGWWSGTLAGRPAMGFERNRGYTTYSTADLRTRFAWWSKGSDHGSY